jgi:hypothetical protein
LQRSAAHDSHLFSIDIRGFIRRTEDTQINGHRTVPTFLDRSFEKCYFIAPGIHRT